MDEEKLQRTIEFIIENQAQFTVDMQELKESQKAAEKRFNVLERAAVNLYNAVTDLTAAQAKLTADVQELRENQKEAAERSRETGERLDTVILMVERYLSRNDNTNGNNDDTNGNSKE